MSRGPAGRSALLHALSAFDRPTAGGFPGDPGALDPAEGYRGPLEFPVPAAERRYDLHVVVDRAPSMDLWDDTVRDFLSVTRQAPFRSVRVDELDTSAPDSPPPGVAGADGAGRATRRVLLLATDCLGHAWRDGRMTALLHEWSRTSAVAVVQLLPQRLWGRTGTPVVDVEWSNPSPGGPAGRLRHRPWSPPAGPVAVGGAVPVIALNLHSVRAWAELVTGADGAWHQGIGLLVDEKPSAPDGTRTRGAPPRTGAAGTAAAGGAARGTPQAGRDAARRFLRTAEPDSVRLAALLTVAPVVTVPLLRGMRHRLLPDTGDFSVAEAFLSGLFVPAPAYDTATAGRRAYFFRPGAGEVLMRELGRSDVTRALTVADEFLPPDAWTLRHGWAETDEDPRAAPEPPRDNGTGPELRVTDERLPARNDSFTGRDALLRDLRDTLAAKGNDLCVLQGEGGVGKTQTALEYAHRHRDDYDFVWWVEAGDAAKARQSLEQLGTALGVTPDPGGAVPAEAVLDRLRNGRTRSGWLLVMNNAESPERLGPLLPRGRGHVIVTSRSISWTIRMPYLRVAPFQRPESKELLHRLVADLSDEDADALAEKAGDLPLVLVQFGCSLAGPGLDVAGHLAEFDEICAMLLRERPLPEYPLPVAASWQVTLDSLRDGAQDAVDLLHLLCFLGAGPVPQDLLFAGVGREMPLGPGHVLRGAVELHQALYRLGDAGLATVDKDTRTIEVHRVLQLVVRHTFMEEYERRRAGEAVLCLLATAVPDDPTAPESRLPMTEISRRLNLVDALASERDDVGDLVVAAVRHHHTHGDRNVAATIAELAAQSWHTRPEPRRRQLEAMRRCLEQASPGP